MIIAIDFDGTCVDHTYPNIGKDVPLAVDTLKELVSKGHQLILYTMRSGKQLADAVDWFENKGVDLYAVQSNPKQLSWTSSPKCYAHIYIDDSALGCPLVKYSNFNRICVDWDRVSVLLSIKDGVL